jgi:hypothetical protein
LTKYLETLNVDIAEFYAEVRQAQDETTDPYLLTFINCLVASTDYDSFYKVMVKEGRKCKLAQTISNTKKLTERLTLSDDNAADAKESMRSPLSTKEENSSPSRRREWKSEQK